ncbi:3-hydroxyacyl-CoA dehydrogenase family protein [Fodinisporobacter ferrooxydans]|uniref:3-hydroxyacyl-CoA dehydrogenase family protein n=1 Tax=Fodinisporobacter ferrooxydans TaxID=2901836 RepID=A0ABY4CPR2_9BACL|nr:3-hydroxyacyl-CoA dehydrogenase family protein [Alicyclobacillaceae bacterium MYW30-H2]
MTMTNNVIVLAGNGSLYQELAQLLEDRNYQVIDHKYYEIYKDRIRFAVEVTNVDLQMKKAGIQKLDQVLPAHIPILSTSLAITATEIASWAKYPDRICGFGTLVPLSERNLIEIAPALQTSRDTIQMAESLIHSLGKEVEIVDDEAGLVFPRILSLIINEAAFTVMEGTATPGDIDIAMKKGTNYPYGPLEWADRIGLDEVYAIVQGLHKNLAEERYRPAPLLRKKVLAGMVGVRNGQGFYTYEKPGV